MANIHNAVLPNPGESIEAVVSILPSEVSGGRLVLDHVPLATAGSGFGAAAKIKTTTAAAAAAAALAKVCRRKQL